LLLGNKVYHIPLNLLSLLGAVVVEQETLVAVAVLAVCFTQRQRH
jgi:hypothetical protein